MSGPCFSASVGGHPLRSPTRRRLGRPLPCQLADGTQAPPQADRSFSHALLNSTATCGISSPFELLSLTSGQVTHALLTRSPLRTLLLSVRLACIKHAASVHPEPGSNSPHIFSMFFTRSFMHSLELSKASESIASGLGRGQSILVFLSLFSC